VKTRNSRLAGLYEGFLNCDKKCPANSGIIMIEVYNEAASQFSRVSLFY